MRVRVDNTLCESNGVCVKLCPEVFELDDDDDLLILIENPGVELREKLEHAVARCPRQALRLEEDA